MKNFNVNKFLIVALSACFLTACGSAATEETGNVREETVKEVFDLPDSDITIPKTLVGKEMEDISSGNAGNENPDPDSDDENTVTYHLTGAERSEILNSLASDIEGSISQILADKDYYPDITDIKANSDYTEFNIYVNSDALNLYESTLLMSFITIGDKYQIYNGVPMESAVTTVVYTNSETGTELARSDSTSVQ